MQGSSRSAPPAAWRALLVCVFALAAHGPTAQAQAPAVGITPGLGDEGKAAFAEFRAAPTHKAFAIAPGGAWAWQANLPTREAALAAALEECAKSASQRCAPYMIDDGVVFDARAWPALWAPYPTAAQTAQAAIGNARGQRLYDLALTAPDGRATHLGALWSAPHTRLLIVHFWGSWCGPCRRELPQLRDALRALGPKSAIAAVFIQVREPVATARAWLTEQHLDLPVFDSGARDERDARLRLADGRTMNDREIAPAFPSTYVLDSRGVVLFAHAGAVSDWSSYLPLLRHAAQHAGR